MVANIRGYTPNYDFKLINFDTPRWHTLEYDNWNLLDTLLGVAGVLQVDGTWNNSTTYTVGQRIFDSVGNHIYRVNVQHVSSPFPGTFAADRATYPTYWSLQSPNLPDYRATWQPSVLYEVADIIVVSSYKYYYCNVRHQSTASFANDLASGFWVLVWDATAAVNAAAASASAAQSSANAAAASAVTAAGYTDSLYATSTSNLSMTPTAVRTFVIQAGKGFKPGMYVVAKPVSQPTYYMYGWVQSYYESGGSWRVDVQMTAAVGSGTFNNWTLAISGPPGPPGSTGLQGDPGVQGPAGVAGATGAVGPAGPQGPIGLTGTQGPQGVAGVQGPVGPQGSTGTGILMKGSVATVGNLPPSGNTQGDAYIVQADDSLHIWDGSAWVSGGSIQGPPGAQGTAGATGAAGPQGIQGIQGIPGTVGATGPQGVQGEVGPTGADSTVPGPQGLQGPAGPQGVQGDVGPTGAGGTMIASIGVDPPGSPVNGQLWWESDNGQLYIYYNDGTSSQWVSAALGAQGPGAAVTSQERVELTQAEYDALEPPNPNTLYIIVEKD